MENYEDKDLKNNLRSIANSHNTFDQILIIIIKRFISKKNKIRLCKLFIFSILFMPISLYIVKSNNTYNHIINLIEQSNNLMIPLFTVVFTGYSIFQAFTSGKIVLELLSINVNNKSQFEEFNLNFFETIMYYLLLIGINYLGLSILPIIYEIYLTNTDIYLNTKKFLPIIVHIYIFFNMYALLEIRSFLFNIYQCFNMSAFKTGIDELQQQKSNT